MKLLHVFPFLLVLLLLPLLATAPPVQPTNTTASRPSWEGWPFPEPKHPGEDSPDDFNKVAFFIPYTYRPCNATCHCGADGKKWLYYEDPSHPFPNRSALKGNATTRSGTVIAIGTGWYLYYASAIDKKLNGLGFTSKERPENITCGWHFIEDVVKDAVDRGRIEWYSVSNRTEDAPSKEVQEKIRKVLLETYPAAEILLIALLTLSPLWTPFFVCALLAWCCGPLLHCIFSPAICPDV